jgi:chloramphenicol O-acetyltransferase type A
MKEMNPKETSRSAAFDMWMTSPMPMVTLTKTFEIKRLISYAKKHHLKFNMLLCWCIGRAAARIEPFYMLPVNGKLFEYDKLAINVIVPNANGGINSCDIPLTDKVTDFNSDYLRMTKEVALHCKSTFTDDAMVVGTSAMVSTELDCIVNQYTDKFCNPMVMWGKYRKNWFNVSLPISFQFHHVQMDGAHASRFLRELQIEINNIRRLNI